MRLLILAVVLVALAACGAQKPASFDDAKATATTDVHEAIVGAFPSGTYLEELPPQDLNCTDTADNPTGEVMAGVVFLVHLVNTSKSNDDFDKLKEWWSDHGWSVATDSRPKEMFMNANRNGYAMSVHVVGDRMTIGDTAPCIKGNGAL